MTRPEAKLYLELLRIAFDEGKGTAEEYELGRKLRDQYFPRQYDYLFEDL